MKAYELIRAIDDIVPRDKAEAWDNPGHQAGDKNWKCEHVLVALDLTDEVVERAVDIGADFILTHHPLIFSPIKAVTADDFITRRIVVMLSHKINYMAAHTNHDVVRMGNLAGDMMGLKSMEPLDVTTEIDGEPAGLGVVGDIEPMTVSEFAMEVKNTFDLPAVRIFGETNTRISRVAICPGSGKSAIDCAIEKDADILLTGDIDHHHGIDAVAQGLIIMDAGHAGLEHIFVNDMAAEIADRFPKLRVTAFEGENPFITL
ncbi:MAG: Nif3-like dinuclear metal center hexameric protein [Lachnospiraceae bacterium]|nr:Nif3-like dinuclear metal center hexameric protein [Lachnospiraceae bacterium]